MKYLSILILCFLIGCSTASTSMNSKKEALKPHTYAGTVDEIQNIAFAAAKRAFPEEDAIYKNEDGKITIERDWFWRGDTIIEIWVKKADDQQCVIEAESKGNWHRGNAALVNVSEGELVHYMSTLELEYEDFIHKASSIGEATDTYRNFLKRQFQLPSGTQQLIALSATACASFITGLTENRLRDTALSAVKVAAKIDEVQKLSTPEFDALKHSGGDMAEVLTGLIFLDCLLSRTGHAQVFISGADLPMGLIHEHFGNQGSNETGG